MEWQNLMYTLWMENFRHLVPTFIIIDHVALAKPGDNALGSVRLSVHQLMLSELNGISNF